MMVHPVRGLSFSMALTRTIAVDDVYSNGVFNQPVAEPPLCAPTTDMLR